MSVGLIPGEIVTRLTKVVRDLPRRFRSGASVWPTVKWLPAVTVLGSTAAAPWRAVVESMQD